MPTLIRRILEPDVANSSPLAASFLIILEHEAGHHGQVNLPRHQYRLANPSH